MITLARPQHGTQEQSSGPAAHFQFVVRSIDEPAIFNSRYSIFNYFLSVLSNKPDSPLPLAPPPRLLEKLMKKCFKSIQFQNLDSYCLSTDKA